MLDTHYNPPPPPLPPAPVEEPGEQWVPPLYMPHPFCCSVDTLVALNLYSHSSFHLSSFSSYSITIISLHNYYYLHVRSFPLLLPLPFLSSPPLSPSPLSSSLTSTRGRGGNRRGIFPTRRQPHRSKPHPSNHAH